MGLIESTLLPLLISGLLLSGIYLLTSVGLSLVFGVMEVVNFAHGAVVMVGGYGGMIWFRELGLSPLLSLAILAPLLFGAGYVLQLGLLERILNDNEIYSLLLTFGLALALEGSMKELFGTTSRSIVYLNETIDLAVMTIAANRVVAGVLGFLFTGVLFVFLSRSTYGKAIRATAQAPDLAEACGINAPRVRAITFGIGTLLAGAGGVMYLLVFQVSPIGGRSILLIMFIIIVLGGMASMKGTAVAAVIVGVFQVNSSYFMGGHATFFILFSAIAIILLVKPHGLFGEPEERHG
jgi:branched-chain amino acid transport system permease protein